MKLIRIVRYRMDFERKWLTASGVLMGIALFLQVLHYFAAGNIAQAETGELVLYLVLPLVLEAAWFLLLRGFQLNAPGIYGILGAAFSVLLVVQTFAGGSFFSGMLSLGAMVLATLALLAVTGGFLRSRFTGVVVFLGCIVLRVLFGGLEDKLLEAAVICDIGAMLLLFGGLEAPKKDKNT